MLALSLNAVSGLSWDLVRWYTFLVVLDLTMQDLNAQVCPWIVPGCHILNASHTDLCVNGHVALVMVILQSGCSTALVVSAAHKGFL